MGTFARGRARSYFPGESTFGITSFVLILLSFHIFLERATVPCYGYRPSHFRLPARDTLFQRRFFFAPPPRRGGMVQENSYKEQIRSQELT